MCGIWGVWQDGPERLSQEASRRVSQAIRHRGPDACGRWDDELSGLTLGHVRLSILDLSPAGSQPMVSDSGRFVLVYNGEAYNHLELRRELERNGLAPRWCGHSDTETILASVSAYGVEATLRRLTGMFAFALWDRESRELILARDRFGEKPLYYGWLQGRFVFASELKALTALPQWRAEIDRNALALLIRFGYVPAPHCIWQGLRKLLPGHWLRINSPRENSGERSAPYWSMAETVRGAMAKPFDGDVRQALDGLHERLSRTIRRQMIADVPLGAFLSGGIDSSLVVALMQEQSLAPVRTFSIGFQDPQYNEAEQAKAVARHLGTAHTELYVTPQETLGVIPLLPSLYDEPFADASQVPTSILCRLVRSQVTVSLSGDGGDELFGGYNRYSWGRTVWNQASPWPAAWRRLAARCVTAVPAERWNTLFRLAGPALPAKLRQRVPGDRLHKLAGVLDADSIEDLYLRLVSSWPDPANIVNEGCEASVFLRHGTALRGISDMSLRMMFLDAVTYLPDDILVKVDRAAMAVSLETRVPYLDHEIAEYAWRLPLEFKIRDGQTKWVLRQLLYRYVPPALVERPKMGFGIPIDAWLRGPLRDWAESLLDEARLQREGFFRVEPIRRRWMEHLSGRRNWQYSLWTILMFQAWLEVWG